MRACTPVTHAAAIFLVAAMLFVSCTVAAVAASAAPAASAAKAAEALDLGNGIKLELMTIPAGKFMMGSPANEAGREDNETQHEVTISQPFSMGKYLVTQEQYEAVMGANPSQFKGAKNPVDQVSWTDAQDFCKKLSATSGKTVRLPTEAEWEYACRAGTTTRFYTGAADSDLDAAGWYSGNSGNMTHPVGQKTPNGFGLYDMAGNVWEWCQDWYGDYPSSAVADPTGPTAPAAGANHVLRGGSWDIHAEYCRSADRGRNGPGTAHHRGFRVVVSASRTH